jgi:hypothetical protein
VPAIGPHDAPPHAGQVVRRMLLRRNIVIDAGRPRSSSPPPFRPRSRAVRPLGRRAGADVLPLPIARRCSDNGSCPRRGGRPVPLLHIGASGLSHLSGAEEQGPRDVVAAAVDFSRSLWLLRLNGDPVRHYGAARRLAACLVIPDHGRRRRTTPVGSRGARCDRHDNAGDSGGGPAARRRPGFMLQLLLRTWNQPTHDLCRSATAGFLRGRGNHPGPRIRPSVGPSRAF